MLKVGIYNSIYLVVFTLKNDILQPHLCLTGISQFLDEPAFLFFPLTIRMNKDEPAASL